jgi:hypothetical protein
MKTKKNKRVEKYSQASLAIPKMTKRKKNHVIISKS